MLIVVHGDPHQRAHDAPLHARWPGGVETSDGVHLHHFVWGIFLMLGSRLPRPRAAPAASRGAAIVAAVFGVGAGFTLDEFALWTRMEDVYWRERGAPARSTPIAVVATRRRRSS